MQFHVPTGERRQLAGALGAAPGYPSRPVCSTSAPTACVRSYVVGGKTVWGSYQAPELTAAIRKMQADLVMLDRQVVPSGLVDATTVLALTNIVKLAATKNIPADGNRSPMLDIPATIGQIAIKIAEKASYGDQGFTAQQIAKNAETIGAYVSTLAHSWYQVKWFGQPAPKPPAPVEPKAPKPSPSSPPVPNDLTVADDGSGLEPKLPWLKKHPNAKYYIGGGVLAAGLLAATLFVWFAPAKAGGMRDND